MTRTFAYPKYKPLHKQRVVVGTSCFAEIPAWYHAGKDCFFRISPNSEIISGNILVWASLPSLEGAIARHKNNRLNNEWGNIVEKILTTIEEEYSVKPSKNLKKEILNLISKLNPDYEERLSQVDILKQEITALTKLK